MPSLACLVYVNSKNLIDKVNEYYLEWIPFPNCDALNNERTRKKRSANTHSVEWNSPETRYMSIKCSARYLTLIVYAHKLWRVQFIYHINIWRRNASWFRYCFYFHFLFAPTIVIFFFCFLHFNFSLALCSAAHVERVFFACICIAIGNGSLCVWDQRNKQTKIPDDIDRTLFNNPSTYIWMIQNLPRNSRWK